ncbi:MAG: peroxiredoxin family protein [Alphaproteobacteria bacterium]|nr:peroxiredoxin family protein [Alphaproteobacteria bacterium]
MEKHKSELEAQGAKIIAGSVDDLENAKAVAAELSFPVAYGMTKADAETLGAWWGEMRGGIMQPSEFLLARDSKVLHAMYATGPVGRMAPDELARLLTRLNSM